MLKVTAKELAGFPKKAADIDSLVDELEKKGWKEVVQAVPTASRYMEYQNGGQLVLEEDVVSIHAGNFRILQATILSRDPKDAKAAAYLQSILEKGGWYVRNKVNGEWMVALPPQNQWMAR